MTIKREALKTRNDAKKGYIKFESTQVPVTPNMGRPTYKLPGPVCNSLVSEYRIVLKRDWTPGAVSVTEYAQKDNSQNNRIQPMSESKDMGKTPEKTVCASIAGNLDQGSKQQLSQFMSHMSNQVPLSGRKSLIDQKDEVELEVELQAELDVDNKIDIKDQDTLHEINDSKDEYYSSLDFHKSENRAELADEVNAVYSKVEAA